MPRLRGMALPSFFQAVHISELFADATKRAFGITLPVAQDLGIPCPAFEPMTFADGDVTVSVVTGGSRKDLLPRPLRLVRAAWSKLPRFPVDAPCTDDEGLQYRAACLRDFLGPVRRALAETPDLAPFIAAHAASFGRGAVAMPAVEVVSFLVTHGIDREDAERAVADVEERGAVHEYDAVGRAFVAHAKERIAAQARADEETRARAALEASPNEVTIGELGWVCIARDTRVSHGTHGLQRIASLHPAYEKESRKLMLEVHDAAMVNGLLAHLVAGPFAYTFIPRAAFLGIDLDEVPLPFGLTIEKSSFVVPVSRGDMTKVRSRVETWFFGMAGEPQEKALTHVRWLLELRVRDAQVRLGDFDETTEEGRHRVELYEAFLGDVGAHFLASSKESTFGTAMRMLFDAGHIGLSLADDVTADVLQRAVVKRCKKVPPKWAATRETLLVEARRMRAKGKVEVFAADDFYSTSDDAGILERAASVIFGGDPWRSTIETAVEGKGLVTNEELVEALRAAAVDEEELASSKRDKRIHKVMTTRGFEKKNRRSNGEFRRVWVRTSGASA